MSFLREVSNPPNPYLSTDVEYLPEQEDDVKMARLKVLEDSTKEILSSNDSPDLGFNYSVNPYRGCVHACAYCLDGDTPIWMANGSVKALRDVRIGDLVCGTERRGAYRRFRPSRVSAHWSSVKAAHRVRLQDGTEIIASGDHRFLTARGWKHVTGAEHGSERRPHLTTNDELVGIGALPAVLPETEAYRVGYLTAMTRGDALRRSFRHERAGRAHGAQFQSRRALVDLEALERARVYLRSFDVETPAFLFSPETSARREVVGIRTHRRDHHARIESLVEWPANPSLEWDRGFLAGMFDAEGSHRRGVLRISNTDPRILDEVARAMRRAGYRVVFEPPRGSSVATNIRLLGGLRERLRFFRFVHPAIRRKLDIEGVALENGASLRVLEVAALGFDTVMYDITTETGDFIANGVVSHNCYARPSHEYLGFGAGTDFDRIITVKPRAAELLRAAFDKKSWQGEFVMFSGITDCYQPLEASYRLTRGCLEVCLEYRNPCGIITKSPLIERDLDLLVEINKVTQLHVALSIPLWDEKTARAIEPTVTTPARRMRTVERLAKAGLYVTVNVAPLIPGIGEQGMVPILEAAKAAGAQAASLMYLRLPGSVANVFEERVKEALPLRAEAILNKVRRARGGKLYESKFGERMRGQGEEAGTARALFDATVRRLGLTGWTMENRTYPQVSTFLRPPKRGDQLSLL